MKMKWLLVCVLLALAACNFSCKSDKKKGDGDISSDMVDSDGDELPVLTFGTELHDFGKITQGEKVSYSFKFKNTGKKDLIIASAVGSCGCTVAQPPKKPVAPGSDGAIDVTFDSAGKSGHVTKLVTVISNCIPNSKVIKITADIYVPQKTEEKK